MRNAKKNICGVLMRAVGFIEIVEGVGVVVVL